MCPFPTTASDSSLFLTLCESRHTYHSLIPVSCIMGDGMVAGVRRVSLGWRSVVLVVRVMGRLFQTWVGRLK